MSAGVDSTVNVAAHLTRMAADHPEMPAIVFLRGDKELSWTYRLLNAETDRIARGLESAGLRRGMRAVLMVKPGPEFFCLTFALFKIGAVPVLVDPGMDKRSLAKCLEEAEPEAFIGIPIAHVARGLLGWARKTVKIAVCVGPRMLPGMFTWEDLRKNDGAAYPDRPTSPDETAAILFTSGSTGAPKGAVYSHGNFAAQVEFLRSHFGVEPGEVDLPTFPLFGLFGPALGMTSVIPKMDFTRPGSVEPKNIIEPILKHKVTHLFGSPALLDRVGRWAEPREIILPSLKRVVSAGAPVPAKVLERFQRLLGKGVEIHTPYGATEALPVASISSSSILGETRVATAEGKGVCVGKPLPGVEVNILRISDFPVVRWQDELRALPGEVGEIISLGPQVTREYYGRPEATALAKVRFPDGRVGHRMGDLGYFDDQGRLWFCGRKSQRVETARGPLYTIQVEGVFNQHPEVRKSALVGVGEPGGQSAILIVEPEDKGRADLKKLRAELIDLGARYSHTKCIAEILFHEALPVDIRHNAKIFREKLAVWAAGQLA